MVATKLRSRKLLLIFAFLLDLTFPILDSKLPFAYEATTSSATSSTSFVANETLWLKDEASGKCLGAHGHFGECGDQSLWVWNSRGEDVGDVLLQSAHSWDPFSLSFDSAECIGRKRSLLQKNELTLLPCARAPLSRTLWTFDQQTGRLADTSSLLAQARGPSCVVNSDKGVMQNCRRGYTPLTPVVFNFRTSDAPDPATIASSSLKERSSEAMDYYKCPITGQVFPRHLDRQLGTEGERQVFMGGGVFSRAFMGMNFHIYSMGWYVDSEAAQDASLAPFRGAPLHQLRQNEDFFEALAARGDYDRTLFVKLAMTLKTQILLEGFLAEIYLLPKNKAIVAAASAQYTEPVCPQGLEILFSWRKGGGGGDMLEVRIGKMVFALEEPGLAEDFMRQFFSQEPVSPGAKMGFASGFPALLGAQGARAFPIVPPTQPTSAPQAPSAAQSSEDQRQDQRQGLRKRARRFVKDKLRAAERLADKLKAHLQNLDFEPKDGQRWLRHLHFVADQHAPSHGFMEYAASVFVLLYCCLLILLSMPPALLHNGVSSLRRGVGAQRQRLREIKSTLCRSINSSSTLKQLGRTAAEISMG